MKALSLLPALILAFWVERNCTLPWVPKELGWPWIFVDGELSAHVLWNSLFVFVVSAIAVVGLRFHVRTWLLNLIVGTFGILMMSLWQPTGQVLFQIIPHAALSSFVSFFIFWGLIGVSFRHIENRKRVALLFLSAVLFTPFLTLDRAIIAGAMLFTLIFIRENSLAR